METNIKLKEIKINSSIKKYELKTTLLGYANKGLPGKDGKDGINGENGVTFTPSVDDEGNLSWTNDGNLDNPETKNIKGPKGDKGDTGEGVANGGTIGQVLVKNSNIDGDTSWSNGTFIPLSPNNSAGNQYDLLLVSTGQYYITEAADVYWGTVQLSIPDDLWKTGTMVFIKTFQEELSISNSNVLCNCSHIFVVNRCGSTIGDTVMENIFCYKEVSGDNIGVIGYNIATVDQLNDAMSQVSENIQYLYDAKQDTLVSGTNIKTINNQSLLGEGNITIEGGSGGTTDYDQLENRPQINNVILSGNKSLSDLGITNFSGDYDDLSNKPNIPTKTSDLTNDSGFLTNSIVELHGTTDNPVNLNTLEVGYYNIYGRYTIGQYTYSQDVDKSTPFLVGDWGQYSSAIYKLIIDCSGSVGGIIEYYTIKHETSGEYFATQRQIQDTLISGTNIKTINNESILGEGNLTIDTGTSDYNQLENKPDLTALNYLPIVNASEFKATTSDPNSNLNYYLLQMYMQEHNYYTVVVKPDVSFVISAGNYSEQILNTDNAFVIFNYSVESEDTSVLQLCNSYVFKNDTIIVLNYSDMSAGASTKKNVLFDTSLKTINNQSLIGEGNITITGGADIPIQATAPENPEEGDFWIDTSANGETYGDTLPIGAIVEYNGATVPDGYEKVSDSARTIMSAYNTSDGTSVSAFGTTTIALDTVISSIGTKLTLSNSSIKIGSGVSKVLISGVVRGYFKNSKVTNTFEVGCRINKNTTIARAVEFIIDGGATINAKLITVAPFLLDVEENDIISLGIYSSSANVERKYLANSYLTIEVIE